MRDREIVDILNRMSGEPAGEPLLAEAHIDGYLCPLCGNVMHQLDEDTISCYNAECVIYLQKFVRPRLAAPLIPILEGPNGGRAQ